MQWFFFPVEIINHMEKQQQYKNKFTSHRTRSCDYTTYLNAIPNNELQTQTARSYCKFNIPATVKNI